MRDRHQIGWMYNKSAASPPCVIMMMMMMTTNVATVSGRPYLHIIYIIHLKVVRGLERASLAVRLSVEFEKKWENWRQFFC